MKREKTTEAAKYTTERGLELNLRPARVVLIEIAAIEVEKEMRAEGKPIDPPTWTMKLATGEVEILPHVIDDEHKINTLIVPDDPLETARNLAKWKLYERAQAELTERQEEARTKALVIAGVEPFDIPEEDEGWEELVIKSTGGSITIPTADDLTQADERRFDYLWYYHLSPMDVHYLTMLLNMLSQGRVLSADKIEPFLADVRSKVEGRVWASLERAFEQVSAG